MFCFFLSFESIYNNNLIKFLLQFWLPRQCFPENQSWQTKNKNNDKVKINILKYIKILTKVQFSCLFNVVSLNFSLLLRYLENILYPVNTKTSFRRFGWILVTTKSHKPTVVSTSRGLNFK